MAYKGIGRRWVELLKNYFFVLGEEFDRRKVDVALRAEGMRRIISTELCSLFISDNFIPCSGFKTDLVKIIKLSKKRHFVNVKFLMKQWSFAIKCLE